MQNRPWGSVIVAAGSGNRFGSDIPKQFLPLGGKPLIDWSIEAFSSIDEIGEIVVVTPSDTSLWKSFWNPPPGVKTVAGGIRRQDSVLAGLHALTASKRVLIHDAARPLVSASLIRRVMKGVVSSGAAVPVIPVRDTVKGISQDSRVLMTVPRDELGMSQTPQGFILEDILRVLENAGDVTDECSAMEHADQAVLAVAGDAWNLKLTDPEDLGILELLSGGNMENRIGTGLDFHPFKSGIPLVAGGCLFESEFGLSGHSDGDVVLHAVSDALLSAARLGDIGVLFPPGDDRWKDADSAHLLKKVCDLIRGEGWNILQIDITVIAEFPKIAPAREAMINRISEITETDPACTWVKGTTTNTLGDIGRGKGMGCLVITRLGRKQC